MNKIDAKTLLFFALGLFSGLTFGMIAALYLSPATGGGGGGGGAATCVIRVQSNGKMKTETKSAYGGGGGSGSLPHSGVEIYTRGGVWTLDKGSDTSGNK